MSAIEVVAEVRDGCDTLQYVPQAAASCVHGSRRRPLTGAGVKSDQVAVACPPRHRDAPGADGRQDPLTEHVVQAHHGRAPFARPLPTVSALRPPPLNISSTECVRRSTVVAASAIDRSEEMGARPSGPSDGGRLGTEQRPLSAVVAGVDSHERDALLNPKVGQRSRQVGRPREGGKS